MYFDASNKPVTMSQQKYLHIFLKRGERENM